MTAPHRPYLCGFSSLGDPCRTLPELFGLAREFGMQFVELRAVEGTTALPDYFTPEKVNEALRGVPIRLIASDLRLLEAKGEDIAAFCRYAELADTLGAPYVRVFGGGEWRRPLLADDLSRAAQTVERCREELARRGVRAQMLIETHFGFSSSADCERLNARLAAPLLVLWDSHHTWRRSGESPAQTWRRIGAWVRHVHYKDSVPGGPAREDGVHVLPGEGEYPAGELAEVLRRAAFSGGVSLEWEKLWHPELPELAEALPRFLKLFG